MNDDQLIALMAAVLFSQLGYATYCDAVTDARELRSETLEQLRDAAKQEAA